MWYFERYFERYLFGATRRSSACQMCLKGLMTDAVTLCGSCDGKGWFLVCLEFKV